MTDHRPAATEAPRLSAKTLEGIRVQASADTREIPWVPYGEHVWVREDDYIALQSATLALLDDADALRADLAAATARAEAAERERDRAISVAIDVAREFNQRYDLLSERLLKADERDASYADALVRSEQAEQALASERATSARLRLKLDIESLELGGVRHKHTCVRCRQSEMCSTGIAFFNSLKAVREALAQHARAMEPAPDPDVQKMHISPSDQSKRCRCKGCQGSGICSCCDDDLPLPDDMLDDEPPADARPGDGGE